MSKIKNRWIAVIGLLFAFVLCFSLALANAFPLKKASAAEAADVKIEGVVSYDDLSETADNNIYGQENVKAYGWTGWGGFAKILKFDKTYDASAIANSGEGALSFWLYIPDTTVLNLYKGRTENQFFNLDVSSNANYSDNEKWTFSLSPEQYKEMRVGWQRIVMPFSAVTAGNKSTMDWSAVQSMRINTTGMGLSGGYTGKIAEISLTTTKLTKFTVTGDPVTTFGIDYENSYQVVGSKASITQIHNDELGETLDAYGRPNEGGFVTVLKLDQAYSVATANDSAFSVWVYFNSENDLKNTNTFNIDVSSGSSYSDAHKYCFSIHKYFSMCKVGWNNMIIPLESANEKNSMDWNDVQNIRLNVDGGAAGYILMAKFEVVHSKYTEPTVVGYVPPVVDPEEPEPDPTVTLTEEGMILPFSSTGGMETDTTKDALAAIMKLDGNTTAQYVIGNMNGSWSTWGGAARQLTCDVPYDVSAISSNAKGALTFWLYIHDQATLAKHKEISAWGVNVSSGTSFSDAKKWEYNIAQLSDDLIVGWNQIVIPVSSFAKPGGGPENNVVGNIRLVYEPLGGGGTANIAFADFGFFLREETAPTVINAKTLMTRPDDVAFSIANAGDFTVDNELLEGNVPAYSAIGKNWGGTTQTLTLSETYDLSDHDLYGKAVLTFRMYFEDETTLEAHRSLTSGYTVSLGSGSAAACSFDIAPLFADCSVGWNDITLPVCTADANSLDWSNVNQITLSWTKAFDEGECEVAFAQFSLVSTDETTRSVENESGISISVKSIAEFSKAVLVRSKKNVTAFSILEAGWGRFDEKQISLAKTYDAQKFAQNGALGFWLYIGTEGTLKAYQGMTGGWNITLYSGAYQSATKLTFSLYSLFDDCIVGWNYLVLPFSQGGNANLDFSAISNLSIEVGGLNKDHTADSVTEGNNRIAVTQFSVIATELTQMTVVETISDVEDDLDPISERIIINCDRTSPVMFSGNTIDTNDMRQGTGCVRTEGAGYGLSAQFETGATDLRQSTIVLALWLWVEDPELFKASGVNGQIEISSSNSFDTNELFWEINQWGELEAGWNWVVLKGSDGNISGGAPNFDDLCRFRIYVNNVAWSTLKIDRITIGYVGNTALFSAPDWEKEISGSEIGGFIGDNASPSKGGPTLAWDESEAEDYTYTVTETVDKYVETVSTALVVSLSVVGGVVVAAVVAVAVVVVLKKKKQS